MSRIGNLPITIPSGVSIHVDDKSHEVTIKGPRGELKQIMDPSITLEWENDILHVRRQTEQKRHKALHGLYRSLVANMVKGVSEGFTTIQELVGTGYKAQATNQVLTLSLGYSPI